MVLPNNITEEKNRIATPNTWLVLLEITLTDSTIFRLVKNDEDVVFEGNTYTKFNFQLEPTVQESKGQIPTLTLRVSNITFLLQDKLQELNGGVGSTVRMIVVNSNLLAEDFSDLEMNFDVLESRSSNKWIDFILGTPSPLRQSFPMNTYIGLLCSWRFEAVECAYERKIISDVILSNPVAIDMQLGSAESAPFVVDDLITLYTVNGITGGIEGNYLIKAVIDTDTVTLKTIAGVDVDGADFGGTYINSGEIGYTTCERTLTACRKRQNAPRFGGFPGMRSGAVRIA